MKPPLSLIRLALRNPSFSHKPSPWIRSLSSAAASRQPTDRVVSIVDDISNLTLVEVADLTNLLRDRLGVDQMPMLAVISPGMSLSGGGAAGPTEATEEKKEEAKEKTAFDVKLEGFDAAAKIKVIKEVRGFTDLGLKEAKDLVEKAPVVVKQGVSKEEAEKIMEKLKGIGAKVVLE